MSWELGQPRRQMQPYRPMFGQLDLFRNMTDLFNDLDMAMAAPGGGFDLTTPWTGRRAGLTGMNVDVRETDDNVLVMADLPGVKKEDISVDFNDDTHMLTVSAQRAEEKEEDRGTIHMSERSYGQVQRSFTLPETTSADSVKADYQSDGVLKLTFTKKPVHEGIKKIKIG